MRHMQIGCGQITWGTFKGWAERMPEEQVLAEIAQAGFEGAPASARGGRSPSETIALYTQHGLHPAPGYLGATFWDRTQEAEILERATQAAQFMQAMGCTELYVAASPLTRREASGQVRPEDALPDEEWPQFVKTLNRVGEITLAHGVASCFHNHVGSVIETREEIDRLFSLVDRGVVFHGPDIGHLAWAGADPVAYCQDYASDIKSVHLKDISPSVLAEGISKGWDYGAFSEHGIFAELGEGDDERFHILSE